MVVPLPGHWDGGGWLNQPPVVQQAVVAEAGVARSTVRIQDPEGRAAAGWTGAIARDDHLRSLADHVPAEPDPRSTGQLQPDAGRLADGGRKATAHVRRTTGHATRRLQHHERDPGAARERGEAPQSIGESRLRAALSRAGRRLGQPAGQVDDEQVHRPAGQERAGDREALLWLRRGQDHQPLRLDPAGDGLDRVEGLGEVQPGDDGAGRLRLGREPQRERGPPARGIAAQRHAHPPRHAAGAEDAIEFREPCREDPIRVRLPAGLRFTRCLHRHGCQRADDLAGKAGCGRAPARSQSRKGGGQIGGRSNHRPISIEQMFE